MVLFGLQGCLLEVELQSSSGLCGLRKGLGEVVADTGSGSAYAVNRTCPYDAGLLAGAPSETPMC